MKKAVTLIFFSFFLVHCTPRDGMVWSDEFDYVGQPDASKWTYDLGNGCPEACGWGNNELQFYTNNSENVRVEDDKLIIEVHPDTTKNYTSARLVSTNKGSWLYGTIEVRAKLPRGRGTWPAIWMLPTGWEYGGWPQSGEIDIMEHVGYDHGTVHGTVHTESFNHIIGTQKGESIEVENVDNNFHTYSIVWDTKGIGFFVDGKQYNYFENTGGDYKEWPFNKPFHMVLNIALGGNWGGKEGVDSTVFPQKMEIEYVRVYQ